MFEGIRSSLGLDIAVAVILLLPITLVVMGRRRKRSEEAETRHWVAKSALSKDGASSVKPPSAAELPAFSGAVASNEVPQAHRGLLRRVGHGITHLLDDRQPSGYSSVAPRRSDGSRTKVFFFNGNGRGR